MELTFNEDKKKRDLKVEPRKRTKNKEDRASSESGLDHMKLN